MGYFGIACCRSGMTHSTIVSIKMKMCLKENAIIIYGITLTLPTLQGSAQGSCQYLEEILDLNDAEKSQYNLKGEKFKITKYYKHNLLYNYDFFLLAKPLVLRSSTLAKPKNLISFLIQNVEEFMR